MKSHHLLNQIYIGSKQKPALYDLYQTKNVLNSMEIVVFIHGYMGFKDWGCWGLVAHYFVENNLSFAKLNLTHNGTTIKNAHEFVDLESFGSNSYSNEIEDIKLFISHIKTTYGFQKIHLIGHSRGGGMAILGAQNQNVQTVTCWAPISSVKERFPENEALKKWKESGVYFKLNSRTKQEMPHYYSQYEDFLKNQSNLDIEKAAKFLNKSVFVVHGEYDESVLPEEGRQVSLWSNGEFLLIPNTAHTFGSSHPWKENSLPSPLEQVCKKTISHIKSKT